MELIRELNAGDILAPKYQIQMRGWGTPLIGSPDVFFRGAAANVSKNPCVLELGFVRVHFGSRPRKSRESVSIPGQTSIGRH